MAESHSITNTSEVNLPQSRKEAKLTGHTRYFNGNPCKHGHMSERLTVNGSCCACSRERERLAYWGNREENLRYQKKRRDADLARNLKKKELRRQKDPSIEKRLEASAIDRMLRESSLQAGDTFYKSNRACPKNHAPVRYSKSGQCVECNRIACREKWLKNQSPEEIEGRILKAEKVEKRKAEKEEASRLRRQACAARQRAIESGDKTYISPRPCIHGHTGPRYTSGSCVECASLQSASEDKKLYDSEYYRKNKDAIARRERVYREKNKDRIYENVRQWALNNPEKVRAIKNNYKVKRRSVEGSGIRTRDLVLWKNSQIKICYWCGVSCKKKFHVDHYVPLSKGGSHQIENLVIACPSCNLKKSAKDPYDFAQEVGRLF